MNFCRNYGDSRANQYVALNASLRRQEQENREGFAVVADEVRRLAEQSTQTVDLSIRL